MFLGLGMPHWAWHLRKEVQKWSPQQRESRVTPSTVSWKSPRYSFISLGLQGRASGISWYFGEKGGVMVIS